MWFSVAYLQRILKHKTVTFLGSKYTFKVEYEDTSLLFLVFFITRFGQVDLCWAMNFTNTIIEGKWSIKKLKNVGLKTWKSRIENCHTQKYEKLNYSTTVMSYNHTFLAFICPQVMIIMTWFSNSSLLFFLFFRKTTFFSWNLSKVSFHDRFWWIIILKYVRNSESYWDTVLNKLHIILSK